MATTWPLLTHGLGTEFLRGPLMGLKVPKGCILHPCAPRLGFALTKVSHLWDELSWSKARAVAPVHPASQKPA